MSLLIPGLPALPPSVVTPALTVLASEAISSMLWVASLEPPAWGVFDDTGAQVLDPDSVLEFANRNQREISKYPIQAGEFASYNKVAEPFEIQLRFSKGGTEDDRAAFLDDLDTLLDSLDLFTVVTPEHTYQQCNLERFEVTRRGARGAYFLTEVDAYFQQILESQAQYTTTAVQLPNAQNDAAQPQSNVGNVQPQTPSTQLALDGESALSAQGQFPQGYGP